ncbi:MAG: UDP-N-acetylmuramate dehydrogenase [Candidatus Nealsonbacteria bacterium]|nr:UDP-N-acetylmuramate dehydrogenase [Candidatus Nealsonbacteria bacterium]
MNFQFSISNFQKNVPLNNHTTFKIGGPAKYFFAAKTKEDIIQAINWAKKNDLPFFILGGGSNMVVSDKGFNGLVIKIQTTNYKLQAARLHAEAGVLIETLVRETGKLGLSGFEWAGGLPGTLGGAIRGNAGAFGGEIKDNIIEVEALDNKGRIRKFSKKQCRFSYRDSIFKDKNWIILSAIFVFKNGDGEKIKEAAREHINYRKERHPLEYPSAGSVFKNCDLKDVPINIRNFFKDVVKTDPFPVVPAAAIIARAGLKGLRAGGAEVSEKHPNYIVNKDNARAVDVLKLIKMVKKKVKENFGIKLEEEIQLLGFSSNNLLTK